MSPTDETYMGLLAFACFWAAVSVASTVFVVMSTRGERLRWAAWFWACSFGVSSLVAAYCFWKLI